MRRPFNKPVFEPFDDRAPRCCQDSLRLYGPERAPTEGVESPCHWCEDTWRFNGSAWELMSRMKVQP